jgi:hypothetical protein
LPRLPWPWPLLLLTCILDKTNPLQDTKTASNKLFPFSTLSFSLAPKPYPKTKDLLQLRQLLLLLAGQAYETLDKCKATAGRDLFLQQNLSIGKTQEEWDARPFLSILYNLSCTTTGSQPLLLDIHKQQPQHRARAFKLLLTKNTKQAQKAW